MVNKKNKPTKKAGKKLKPINTTGKNKSTKKKKKKTIKKDEFRKHKPSGHPAYVYKQEGEDFKFLGLTHSKKDKKTQTKNVPLIKNPNPDDPGQSYIKTYSQKDNKKRFRPRDKNWKMSDKDKDRINKFLK